MSQLCMNCFKDMEGYDVCAHCGWIEGTQPKENYHLWPRMILNERYTIGTVINNGGFGITYKAWDNQLNQLTAIKEYYPAGLVNRIPGEKEVIVLPGDRSIEYQRGLERFLDEARTMAKFISHPYIVDVYNYFEENNTAYIVMEYLGGPTLKAYLKEKGGKIGFDDALTILDPIMVALDELHHKGIIHRDISPDNIMFTEDYRVKLIDLGTARLANEEIDVTRSVVVKPGYTPPEQYRNKSRQGPWTDVYALGATFYHCITGEKPEESIDRKVKDELRSPKKLGEHLPDYADKAIMKALALKAGLRFSKMNDFRLALQNKKMVDYPEIELKKRKVRRIIAVSLCLVLLFGVAGYTWSYEQKYNISIQPATITVWVPAENEEDSAFQTMQEIATEFGKDYSDSDIMVKLVPVPAKDYVTELKNAMGTENMPDLFRTDVDDSDISQYCASLDYLIHTLDMSKYWFLNTYKVYYPHQKEMPTGFSIPLLYWENTKSMLEKSDAPFSWDAVIQEAQQVPMIIDADMLVLLSGAGVTFSSPKDNTISLGEGSAEAVESLRKLATVDAQAVIDFTSQDSEKGLYLGSCANYSAVSSGLGGHYDVALLEISDIMGEFNNCWGVNVKSDENSQYIAMKYIDYLLGDSAQATMYFGKNDVLPLNRIMLEEYFSIYDEWTPSDDYLNSLSLWGENIKVAQSALDALDAKEQTNGE